LEVDEARYFPENTNLEGDLMMRLANLYNRWSRFDKAEPYWRELLSLQEKKYGSVSSVLAPTLNQLAEVLVNLGRTDEATQVRQRMQTILARDK
jgi:tetratricopeptide (TPR) repeat protein